MGDWDNDPQAQAWIRRVRHDLGPKLQQSALTVMIAPGETPDVKASVELGMSILLDLPLVIVVPPGRTLPDHLVRCADELVEWVDDPHEMATRIHAAYRRATAPPTTPS